MPEPRLMVRPNTVLFGIFAVVVLLFIGVWIIDPAHTVEEMTGTIEAVTVQASTKGHAGAERTAMIRLPNGMFIYATVVTPANVRSGQRGKIIVSERVLSGTRTYELVEAVDAR